MLPGVGGWTGLVITGTLVTLPLLGALPLLVALELLAGRALDVDDDEQAVPSSRNAPSPAARMTRPNNGTRTRMALT